MNTTSTLAVIIATLALSGCATQPAYEWRHMTHSDPAQLARDKAQCDYEATSATASYAPNSRGYRTSTVAGIADAIAIGQRQGELIQLCLRARGYSLYPL
jgi:hypothetical protein